MRELLISNHFPIITDVPDLKRNSIKTSHPNVVSFEAINGTEYYKWFTSPSLENRVSYTFTRNVVGSADFTPTGIPVLNSKATAGFALADVVTIESGLQHFAHSVYTYEGSSALPFLNDVPVIWDDMKVLDGRPMQFNVTARRSGNNWYIGASTISARKISVKLSELIDDDGTYNAYIFHDNANGSDLEVTVLNGLTKNDKIDPSLLENGGCVMKITKGSMKLTTPYSNYLSYEAERRRSKAARESPTARTADTAPAAHMSAMSAAATRAQSPLRTSLLRQTASTRFASTTFPARCAASRSMSTAHLPPSSTAATQTRTTGQASRRRTLPSS